MAMTMQGEVVLPAAREFHARQFLASAATAEPALAETLVREALSLDPDATARPEFAPLLQSLVLVNQRANLRGELLRRLG